MEGLKKVKKEANEGISVCSYYNVTSFADINVLQH